VTQPQPPSEGRDEKRESPTRTSMDAMSREIASPATTMPEQLGRYRIVGVLGEGAMGIVYEAEQAEPVSRRVAIKAMNPSLLARPLSGELRARLRMQFEAERQQLAAQQHPGIVTLLDAGDQDGLPYFVMELIEGGNLREHCERCGLSLRERALLAALVCDAVHHIHSLGMLHNDLKPGNILVQAMDGVRLPKIIDLGVARNRGAEVLGLIGVPRGEGLGTYQYMSPEQAARARTSGPASDVYSLGVILYVLTAGRLPYAISSQGVASAPDLIARAAVPPPSKFNPEIDARLERIILRALEKEPSRRPQSAAEFARLLREWAEPAPALDAREPSLRAGLAGFLRRKPIVAALVASIVPGLVVQWALDDHASFGSRPNFRLADLGEWTTIAPAEPWRAQNGLDLTLVVGLNDQDRVDLEALNRQAGVPEAAIGLPRAAFATMIQKLASAKPAPALIVPDVTFAGAMEAADDMLRASLELARETTDRMPVVPVFVPDTRKPDAPKYPSPAIVGRTLEGDVTMLTGGLALWRIELARARPDEDAKPSLALQARAQMLAPQTPFDTVILPWSSEIELRFRPRDGRPGPDPERIRLTEVRTGSAANTAGLLNSDTVARYAVPIPETGALRVVSYTELVAMDAASLGALVGGKVVFLGDISTPPLEELELSEADASIAPGRAEAVPRVFGHAAAYARLAVNQPVSSPTPPIHWAIMLMASGAGAALASRVRGLPASVLAVTGLTAVWWGCTLACYFGMEFLVNPLHTGLMLWTGWLVVRSGSALLGGNVR
jgi:serine/threonine protein kinase